MTISETRGYISNFIKTSHFNVFPNTFTLNSYISYCIIQIPKVLECQHSFCDICLKGYVRSGSLLTSLFPCPTCRKFSMWPLRGVDGFPTDRKVKLILDLMDNLKDNPYPIEESPICRECSEKNKTRKGEYFCLEKMQILCKECYEKHKSSEVLGHHKFIKLTTGDIIQNNPTNKPLCKQHQAVLLYTCVTCQQQLCQGCLFDHKNHQFMISAFNNSQSSLSLSNELLKFQEELEFAKKKFEKICRIEQEREKGLKKNKEVIEHVFKEARKDLDRLYENLLKELKDQEGSLNKLKNFKKSFSSKLKEAEKVLEKDVEEKKKEKTDKLIRSLIEDFNEDIPTVKKIVFQEEMVMRMGAIIEEEDEEEDAIRNSHTPLTSSYNGLFLQASSSTSSFPGSAKDAMIESLKVNTILKSNFRQSKKIMKSIQEVEGIVWKIPAKCRACSFACKGKALVILDSAEREVNKQLKIIRCSDAGQANVVFELGNELINHLHDLNIYKNNLFLLCSTTSQQNYLKKFKLDLYSKQLNDKKTVIRCYESTNLDLLEGNVIEPIAFALRKQTLALLANKGTSLHLFTTKFKAIKKLAPTDFGKGNYVELDEKENLYIPDIARGEIRVCMQSYISMNICLSFILLQFSFLS